MITKEDSAENLVEGQIVKVPPNVDGDQMGTESINGKAAQHDKAMVPPSDQEQESAGNALEGVDELCRKLDATKKCVNATQKRTEDALRLLCNGNEDLEIEKGREGARGGERERGKEGKRERGKKEKERERTREQADGGEKGEMEGERRDGRREGDGERGGQLRTKSMSGEVAQRDKAMVPPSHQVEHDNRSAENQTAEVEQLIPQQIKGNTYMQQVDSKGSADVSASKTERSDDTVIQADDELVTTCIRCHAVLQNIYWDKIGTIAGFPHNLKEELFPYEMPECQRKLCMREGYVSLCDPVRNHPLYVVWLLAGSLIGCLSGKAAGRDFVDDPVYPGAATAADYKDSGYDRGHCKDLGSAKNDKEQQSSCMIPTNIVPQDRNNNMGVWKMLEEFTHSVRKRHPAYTLIVYVIPVIKANVKEGSRSFIKAEVIGPNKVWVPTHLGKVILAIDQSGSLKDMKAWMIPNESFNKDMPMAYFECPLDHIEKFSGFKLLPKLTKSDLNPLEEILSDKENEWKFVGRPRGIQIPEQTDTEPDCLLFLASVLYCSFAFGFITGKLEINAFTNDDSTRELHDNIVSPLQRTGFVSAECFEDWRKCFDSGLKEFWDNAEKQRFIDHLLREVLKFDLPDMRVIDLTDPKDYPKDAPSVQSLLERHYIRIADSLKVTSTRLILCLPQGTGKIRLDANLQVNGLPFSPDCSCGQKKNKWFCVDCYEHVCSVAGSSFCDSCYQVKHPKKSSHDKKRRDIGKAAMRTDKLTLKAVVCYEGDKPMAYCATGGTMPASWVLFDGMAELEDNMPYVKPLFDVEYWLSHGASECSQSPNSVPDDIKTLLESPSVCFYG